MDPSLVTSRAAEARAAISTRSLVLLIPAYNEEQRIGPVLQEFAAYFERELPGRFQLVVVLNGCRDNTMGVVQGVGKQFRSIRGLKLASAADLIGYVDADGATAPQALHHLLKRLDDTGADCAIGSRWMPESVLHQSQTQLRRFISRCFHYIVEGLLWMGIKDTQCPAKVARCSAVQKIHGELRVADMAFDVNFIYALKHAGFTVVEIPIEWTDKIGSKVTQSLLRSSFVMFLSVVRLRLYYSSWYKWLQPPLRPVEAWLYKKLRTPLITAPRKGK